MSGEAAAAKEWVDAADTGGRRLAGAPARLLFAGAVCWSLFQLWAASPLPFMLAGAVPVFNAGDVRVFHLAFAMWLLFLAYPSHRRAPRRRVPIYDWLLLGAALICLLYLPFFEEELADRPGLPTTADVATAGLGLGLLLEGVRRALGAPLMVVAIFFLCYVFFGDAAWLPDSLRWKGASFNKAMSHMWLSAEGVFGVGLGVSASFVFLFVLFGILLDKAGAGNYVIKLSFSLLGHFRGGPAKAAVLSSAMTGFISGSSIANVVTTGTFTVPLMKRVGFSAEKAGAVEVASSVNGQLMPPVMGAAAFLMVEYVGVSYFEVVKHAFLPALISYIALLYIVHLEALRAGMQGLAREAASRRAVWLSAGLRLSALFIFLGAASGAALAVKHFLPSGAAAGGAAILLLLAYLWLSRLAAKSPDLPEDDSGAPLSEMPRFSEVWRTGAYFGLPVLVLVWFLMVERKSPGLSAFYATLAISFIILTQRPLKAFWRGQRGAMVGAWARGGRDFLLGLAGGARNMAPIALATACAGIIVGAVSLTGVGLVMAEFVEFVSGGHVLLMLAFVALLSLILGMGLPTTANYIVVSSLMAGVVVELGAQQGLVVPLIAVHLFVFYFGIMADVTPPVGLASFAAAAVSGGEPTKTGVQAFAYSLRTVLLPFLFIFNTDLLLIDVGWARGALVFAAATTAMLAFAAATQGWFLVKNRWWETALLLLAAFTLFRPGYWLDHLIAAPYEQRPAAEAAAVAGELPAGQPLRMMVRGTPPGGEREVEKLIQLPIENDNANSGGAPLEGAGIILREEQGRMFVDDIVFNSAAEKAGLDFDWEILSVSRPAAGRPPKEIFYAPALLMLLAVAGIQRRRRHKTSA